MLKLDQLRNLLWRVGEYSARRAFRQHGGPDPELTEALRPLVAPAVPASYAFEWRIEVLPVQLHAFLHKSITGEQVAADFYSIIETGAQGGPAALAEVVKDEAYYLTFVQQLRNLAPNGRQLSEVTVAPLSDDRVARLHPDRRKSLDKDLRARRPKGGRPMPPSRGILRGLDLDDRFLILRGQHRKYRIAPGASLDDLIGPLVNHEVELTGESRGGHFYVTDITEAGD